jgi:hypothetical protein
MKTASFASVLVAKKGEAAPAMVVSPALSTVATPPPPVQAVERKQQSAAKKLTLKFDRKRYGALKNACLDLDKTGQDILVEAFDLWLASRQPR